MAAIASYELDHGNAIIYDTCYIGKSAEELEKLREVSRDVARKIVSQKTMQEGEKKEESV